MKIVATVFLSFWTIVLLISTFILETKYPTEIKGQRWYSSSEEAISKFLNEEGLTEKDIKQEIEDGENKFVVILNEKNETFIAELVYENGNYTIISSENFQTNKNINDKSQWIIPYESYHGNNYEINIGFTIDGKQAVKEANDLKNIKYIDEKTGFFYDIERLN
ncbi:hypothetical protein [Cytobacillus oceanisediminis]|uniref:hypothetical protein n=1 Tax=Cytobacillus oceanisediminis TaxID=665099 RepID=UPI00207A616D|nr:hypothetical protein [Cytobacillus oceanisediminis]USK44659.1 hypothetical protein LIT27_01820 [Cytobacillus oceanisediminis]